MRLFITGANGFIGTHLTEGILSGSDWTTYSALIGIGRGRDMKIRIICIGKLKEKYWTAAVAEYSKRIGSYADIEIVELKESKLPANPSPADETNVLTREGEKILSRIKDNDYVIAMEVEGQQLDSVELSGLYSSQAAGRR